MTVLNEDYKNIEMEWLLLMKEAQNIGLSYQEVHTFLTEFSLQSMKDEKIDRIEN